MDAGTNALDILTGRTYPLKLGFIGVVNRSQQDINAGLPMEEALRKEEEFFRNHPAYRNLAHRCGTKYLAKSLNHVSERFRCTVKGYADTSAGPHESYSRQVARYEGEVEYPQGPDPAGTEFVWRRHVPRRTTQGKHLRRRVPLVSAVLSFVRSAGISRSQAHDRVCSRLCRLDRRHVHGALHQGTLRWRTDILHLPRRVRYGARIGRSDAQLDDAGYPHGYSKLDGAAAELVCARGRF